MHGRPSIAGFLRAGENEELIQKVMQTEHVSIQVARNLLKAGQLGVGPGAKFFDRDDAEEKKTTPGKVLPPARFDKKAASRAMEEKLRRMQEEKEDEEEELIAKSRFRPNVRKQIGIARLGPVSSRQEQVDPLKIKVAAIEARREQVREQAFAEKNELLEAEDEPEQPTYQVPAPEPLISQEEFRRLHKEERKKKAQQRGTKDSDDSEEGHAHDNQAHGRNKRARSPSPKGRVFKEGGGGGGGGGAASSSSTGPPEGLMSEAEARKMIRGDRTTETKRGSAGAAARIQRELAEWEQSKAKNTEFWKPPKFCLVLGSGRGQQRLDGRN